MTNLLDELYELGLSTYQVDQTFTIIDKWLEQRYPVMSQVYRQQMLLEILNENREREFSSSTSLKRINANMRRKTYRHTVIK
ncbi:MAG TPA: hypothetical protein VFH07_16450 [Chitinophagaceae bacterium]|nr:hypothetical protein [Chitinophagaceae bacterium]